MGNPTQDAENHNEASRANDAPEAQPASSPWLLLAVIACVAFWTAAIWMNGPTAIAILGILGAVTGATMALVALTSGKIDQKVAMATLWILSCCAIPFLLLGVNDRYLAAKDARLSPQDFTGRQAGSSLLSKITSKEKRTYLGLTFTVTPRNRQAPTCGDSIRLSVRLSWQASSVELEPNVEKDIRLGSPPDAEHREVIMTVRNVEPNSMCAVDVHVRGSLHR
ncbi:hypothetical protein [Actinomadura bangladeshensis]|uniref:Uncharacterized protein n=1 Tax=Actinomadura bangladeshensis TaxID=453573 RepID=A0A4R4PER8_9ACTN|nr:hypothetical protein [Actinomadura bangladeshensis]TDC19632.1 hypothetical protein E1284_02910 [Actinomadura bangladeshensis]